MHIYKPKTLGVVYSSSSWPCLYCQKNCCLRSRVFCGNSILRQGRQYCCFDAN